MAKHKFPEAIRFKQLVKRNLVDGMPCVDSVLTVWSVCWQGFGRLPDTTETDRRWTVCRTELPVDGFVPWKHAARFWQSLAIRRCGLFRAHHGQPAVKILLSCRQKNYVFIPSVIENHSRRLCVNKSPIIYYKRNRYQSILSSC